MLFLSNVVKYLRISCNFSLKPIQWFLVFTALIMSLHSKAFSVSIQLPKSSCLFYKSLGQHTETRNWGCPQEWCPWEYRLRMVEARNFGLLSQPNFRDKPGWPPFASWLVICKQPTAIEGFWGIHFVGFSCHVSHGAGSSWVQLGRAQATLTMPSQLEAPATARPWRPSRPWRPWWMGNGNHMVYEKYTQTSRCVCVCCIYIYHIYIYLFIIYLFIYIYICINVYLYTYVCIYCRQDVSIYAY